VDIHSTACGKALVATEIVTGTVGAIGARIVKPPEEVFVLGQNYKSLLRDLRSSLQIA